MRIWSVHPSYLDTKGLVALWRETLLAQNVLLGNTKGYKNHPQLNRFKAMPDPVAAIGNYLDYIAKEADRRNYNFNHSKIVSRAPCSPIPVTTGQVAYEVTHLKNKLKVRDEQKLCELEAVSKIQLHPLFVEIEGEIEDWEIV